MNNNKRLISTFRALGVKNQVFCNFSPGPAVEKTQMQSIMHSLDTEAASYHNQACYLLKKAESVRGSIADTLNIKFQLTSQEQSESMWTLTKAAQHESVAIRVITLVTMFYLPFSFVAVCLLQYAMKSHVLTATDNHGHEFGCLRYENTTSCRVIAVLAVLRRSFTPDCIDHHAVALYRMEE